MAKKPDLNVGSDIIQALFEISQPTLSRWVKSGAPRSGRNQYNLREFVNWWATHIFSDTECSNDESFKQSRAAWWKERAERERIAVRILKGETLSRDDVERIWGMKATNYVAGLTNLKHRLPLALAGMSAREIEKIIEEETNMLREALLRPDSAYTPKMNVCFNSCPICGRKLKGGRNDD